MCNYEMGVRWLKNMEVNRQLVRTMRIKQRQQIARLAVQVWALTQPNNAHLCSCLELPKNKNKCLCNQQQGPMPTLFTNFGIQHGYPPFRRISFRRIPFRRISFRRDGIRRNGIRRNGRTPLAYPNLFYRARNCECCYAKLLSSNNPIVQAVHTAQYTSKLRPSFKN